MSRGNESTTELLSWLPPRRSQGRAWPCSCPVGDLETEGHEVCRLCCYCLQGGHCSGVGEDLRREETNQLACQIFPPCLSAIDSSTTKYHFLRVARIHFLASFHVPIQSSRVIHTSAQCSQQRRTQQLWNILQC